MKIFLIIIIVFFLLLAYMVCTDDGSEHPAWDKFVREWNRVSEERAQERSNEKYHGFHLSDDCEYINDFSYMPCDWVQQLQGLCEMHPTCQ
jgi:hypothetical protein